MPNGSSVTAGYRVDAGDIQIFPSLPVYLPAPGNLPSVLHFCNSFVQECYIKGSCRV